MRDIRKNPEHLKELLALGARATPVTVIEKGEERHVLMGFDPKKLTEVLKS